MLQVLAKKGEREFYDSVKKSRLAYLIKTGYVIGAPKLSVKEAKMLFDSEKIIVTFDSNKMARFQF